MRETIRLEQAGSLGKRIRRWRIRAGLTQSQLAERLNTTQSVVSRWESGHDQPRINTLRAILRACVLRAELVVEDDVDRAQIRQRLTLTPRERLEELYNVSRFRLGAERID